MSERNRLLVMLAGSPDGLTQFNLTNCHNFAPALIYKCIDHGLIGMRKDTVSTRGSLLAYTVFRFHITPAGHEAIR